jgi:ABC-type bacteriocin/lantibiotic exporter with double-glycine peptidase domain
MASGDCSSRTLVRIATLCLIPRFLGIPAQTEELARHHLAGSSGASAEDLVRIARKLVLKARNVATTWDRLVKTPLPAIAEDRHGEFVIATRFVDSKLLVQRPTESRGRLFERGEFEKAWSGRLVLLGRRASITNLSDIFDLRWFVTAVQRYRRGARRFFLSAITGARFPAVPFRSWSTRCWFIRSEPSYSVRPPTKSTSSSVPGCSTT